jgi:uncharacterized protein (DUF2267 family)
MLQPIGRGESHMSATGLDVFDRTLQATNIWLDEIMQVIGPDRQLAWKVLSVVLQRLRDRLPVALAAHLGAQLPILVRGVYYDQFQPERQPADWDTMDEFVGEVSRWLSDTRPVDAKDATRAVFAVLAEHISQGEVAKVANALPSSLRSAFVTAPEVIKRREDREPGGEDGRHH